MLKKPKINIKKMSEYWLRTAEHDYKTMLGLFKIKRYSDALFYGHIILEKILKAFVVLETSKKPPYIHDLIKLAKLANINFSENNLKLFDDVSRFNIRARYPDYKLRIYKLATKSYTEEYLKKIKKLYKKLCQTLKKKK